MSAICSLNSGIPASHKSFWKAKSPAEVQTIYHALTATPSKVLSLIDEPILTNSAEEVVYGYLRQYIGNMSPNQLRLFLRFVTGSSVCGIQKVEVAFNTLSGLARRPIAHTCGSTLEISSTYVSYPEFMKEFNLTLSSDIYAWIMDSI